MAFSFTKFKDRVAGFVDSGAQWLGTAPKPIQKIVYGLLRGVLWLLYIIPGSFVRKTATAFSTAVEQGPPRKIYRGFIDGFLLFIHRMDLLSQGKTEFIDNLLKIPEQKRFEAILKEHGSAILTMPHCHGSLLMVRGLAARYPVLMLIREPKKETRAAAQRRYFANMGCEVLDVRRNNSVMIARTTLKAMRQGKIIIGVVDRIQTAPPEDKPFNETSDNVRAMAFGQPVGIAGWPARFAAVSKSPILPVMVDHTVEAVTLHIGNPITATDDVVKTTQEWLNALEQFFKRFPDNWVFVYDKHWSRLLRK